MSTLLTTAKNSTSTSSSAKSVYSPTSTRPSTPSSNSSSLSVTRPGTSPTSSTKTVTATTHKSASLYLAQATSSKSAAKTSSTSQSVLLKTTSKTSTTTTPNGPYNALPPTSSAKKTVATALNSAKTTSQRSSGVTDVPSPKKRVMIYSSAKDLLFDHNMCVDIYNVHRASIENRELYKRKHCDAFLISDMTSAQPGLSWGNMTSYQENCWLKPIFLPNGATITNVVRDCINLATKLLQFGEVWSRTQSEPYNVRGSYDAYQGLGCDTIIGIKSIDILILKSDKAFTYSKLNPMAAVEPTCISTTMPVAKSSAVPPRPSVYTVGIQQPSAFASNATATINRQYQLKPATISQPGKSTGRAESTSAAPGAKIYGSSAKVPATTVKSSSVAAKSSSAKAVTYLGPATKSVAKSSNNHSVLDQFFETHIKDNHSVLDQFFEAHIKDNHMVLIKAHIKDNDSHYHFPTGS
ncbi:hypothetical protein HDU67_002659 [Dinochytrium kinnereticum]|nr:hypothetical protein HDU67_002659 [Dinochytrium kinnereticum]